MVTYNYPFCPTPNQGHVQAQTFFTSGCPTNVTNIVECGLQGGVQAQAYQGTNQVHAQHQGHLQATMWAGLCTSAPVYCGLGNQHHGVAQAHNNQGANQVHAQHQGHSPVQGPLGGFTKGCMHSRWPNACSMAHDNQTNTVQDQHIAQNHFDGNIYQNQAQKLGFTGLFCDPTMGCPTANPCPHTMIC